MSDTGKTSTLASIEEFDRRLKSLDEPRWLASRFAAAKPRERLVAVGLLAAELRRAMAASEPMIAKIRLQWWRETLEGIAEGRVRRHDLSEEIARVFEGRPGMIAAAVSLVDRHDDVLDDHLRAGGHRASSEHHKLHVDQESALNTLAAAAVGAPLSEDEQRSLEKISAVQVARQLGDPGVQAKSSEAGQLIRDLRPILLPAIAHYAGQGRPPLSMRWRILQAVGLRRF